MAELRKLGARSVPVVSRGDRFAFAQVIKDVVDFLDLPDDTAPELPPEALATRLDRILETAARLTRQMPDERLEDLLPNRPRSWRVLMHHVYQISVAFLDMEEQGRTLTYEALTEPPPAGMRTSAAVADHGEAVRARFAAWWSRVAGEDFSGPVSTYFGGTTRHEMLERTVWHTAQHVRQVASLLEQAGVAADRPLDVDDLQGLPLTDKVWDES
jgi:hypothetical protein